MNISEISIKRPITVIMFMLIIIVIGVVSFTRIPLDLFPKFDIPVAVVMTNYSGVGPQEVETYVTEVIESGVATVNNMNSIQSETSEGSSVVIVQFNDGTDMDFAALQLREKVDMVKGFLPDDADNPMVIKIDPNMLPIAQIGISSNTYDEIELKKYVEDTISPRFERLDGVASSDISGGIEQEIKIELDPLKVNGYGIPFNSVINLIQMENINLPGGTVEYGSKRLIMKTKGEFESVEEIKDLPISLPQGGTVYLRDLARIEEEVKERDSLARMNGQKSMGISIQKQTDANTVEVVRNVREEIKEINEENNGVELNIVFDQGQYIEKSIEQVFTNAILGALIAILILLAFLRNFRSTLVIAISIPFSIISTFVLMFLANITINMISMGGLALGVGMMVDNSIVVLENIFRHRQEGYSRIESAVMGAKEVSGAIIAATMTTVVVFVPIIFTEGVTSDLFREMALTVSFSLFASLVVALTIIPMLSSKILKVRKDNGSKRSILSVLVNLWQKLFDKIAVFYKIVLLKVLRHRFVTLFIALAIFSIGIINVIAIGMEFIPPTDEGQLSVQIELSEGTLLEETDSVVSEIEDVLTGIDEVDNIFSSIGESGDNMSISSSSTHRATINAMLVPLAERTRSTEQVVEEVRTATKNIIGAEISVSESGMMGSGGGMGLSGPAVLIEISGYDFDELERISKQVVEKIGEVEGTRQIESSISAGRPEANIYVDRDKAARYGMSTMQVSSIVRTAFQGQVASRLRRGGEELDIRVSLNENSTKTYDNLNNLKVVTPSGALVILGELVDIRVEEGPVKINRNDQTRNVTVTADLFQRDSGSANIEIQEKLDNIQLPDGYEIIFGGEFEDIMESFESLFLALILAILLIYMVMAAQFESLVQPFIVMFAVPLAFSGAAIGLALTGRTLNVASFIGIIMLSGIVVNNAIILINYINQLVKSGLDRNEAITTAGPIRLRPILMTTLTTVLAMIPLSIGAGEGSEVEAPLATVVIFGLSFSTMLTLLVIPVIYTLFDDFSKWIRRAR